MSIYARDLKSNLLEGLTIPPQVASADITAPTAVDMVRGDGLCTAVAYLGAINDATTGTLTVEESDVSGSGYAAVPGATMAIVGTDDNTVKRILFQRSKRYVRVTADFSGTISCALAVVVQEQLKQVIP